MASKGAPDVLLARCTHERRAVRSGPYAAAPGRDSGRDRSVGRNALRTIGVAYRLLRKDAASGVISEDTERELVYLGVVGMIDPPRVEANEAVQVARRAGMRSIMITGDHPTTAAAIAAELGLVAKASGR